MTNIEYPGLNIIGEHKNEGVDLISDYKWNISGYHIKLNSVFNILLIKYIFSENEFEVIEINNL